MSIYSFTSCNNEVIKKAYKFFDANIVEITSIGVNKKEVTNNGLLGTRVIMVSEIFKSYINTMKICENILKFFLQKSFDRQIFFYYLISKI